MPNIYTISPHLPFLDTLAADIFHKYGNEPLLFSNITILLPNRRACKALQESFLRISGGKVLLLPQIQPLGDADDESFLFKTMGNYELPNLISSTRERFILTMLIEKWQGLLNTGEKITTAQAANLAIELASFLGEVEKEQLSFANIAEIVPEDLSRHWQITLDFLKILIEEWPKILAEENAVDIYTWRNISLHMQAQYWQENPPAYPVIVAGSTGSIPATANLLRVIASMQNGSVVLPGLDNYMDDQSWEVIGETHPQFGMKQLLGVMGVNREEVMNLESGIQNQNSISHLISEIMRPANTISSWKHISHDSRFQIPDSIELITASSLQEEATVIALILKQTLQTPGKTAALITNERKLAKHVCAVLKKWDVAIDDSSGKELKDTPQAIFLRLLAMLATDKAESPISLLSCLKHPFATNGTAPVEFRNNIRKLELLALRGIRPNNGISGLCKILQNEGDKTLVNWLEQLQETLEPLVRLTSLKSVPFDEILTKHIKVAEKLACTDSQEGADRFYSGAAGEQLKEFLDDLMLPAKNFKAINPIEYSALLDALFVGQVYRSPYGTHPRISILSPIEARMQNFDLVIMGALNEGSWPEGVKSDPWMSRPMRSNFGLPLPEKRIGQSAHDFAQIFCSGQVIMTRSEKMDGTQTIPSRWLLRLSAILKILKAEDAIKSKQPWNKWAELLSKPEVIKACVIPEPKPSVELRPKKLSVTNIEKLMRDPYAIYASKILGLKALDPIDKDPGPAEFGNFVHKALEMFVKGWESGIWNLESRSNLDSRFQILDSLLNCGHEILKQQDLKPAIISFWWPRFERIAKWFAENEPQRREGKLKILSEVSGEYKIGEFTLYARADRIEIDNDGNIAIIDYKTGTVPTQKDIELGFSPQMTLEGLIASKGGFSTNLDSRSQIPDSPISELSHWKLSGSEEAVKGEPVKGQIAELITEAEAGVNQLINIFTNVNTPYLPCPNPDKALGYNDYEHLERVKEWMD